MNTDKVRLRQQFRQQAAEHSDEEKARESARLCAFIREQPRWESSKSVLFFWPLADEPDLRSLFRDAIDRGKVAAFPKYIASSGCYAAVPINDLESDLAAGHFGIPEPVLSSPPPALNVLDLIFVPGIAFNFDGARLGRGKGHYDRLLSQISGTKCGVAYDWQITQNMPCEAHDVRVDCLVTPSGWREITHRRST